MTDASPHQAMEDGLGRRLLKAFVRTVVLFDIAVRRRWLRLRKQDYYRLAGHCEQCAKCCEQPTLHLPWVLFHVRPLRALVSAWQWHVNRFMTVAADDETRSLAFRCGHFDPQTRRCDSYDSRPAMCRDYPRLLLDQAWPDLFPECGYRAVSRNAAALSQALDQTALSEEAREQLKRRLHVIE